MLGGEGEGVSAEGSSSPRALSPCIPEEGKIRAWRSRVWPVSTPHHGFPWPPSNSAPKTGVAGAGKGSWDEGFSQEVMM